VSWLPAPGLETTSTIKPGRCQRTAATTDFPTRTGVRAETSEAWKDFPGTFPTSVDPVKIRQVADLMQRFGELKQGFHVAALTNS
jgi:hypothetical protein